MSRRRAKFNADGYCVSSGWATCHAVQTWRQRLCRHPRRNRIAIQRPADYSPQAYERCLSCGAAGRWFDVHMHRYGGPPARRER